jgi:hypothetical protein
LLMIINQILGVHYRCLDWHLRRIGLDSVHAEPPL